MTQHGRSTPSDPPTPRGPVADPGAGYGPDGPGPGRPGHEQVTLDDRRAPDERPTTGDAASAVAPGRHGLAGGRSGAAARWLPLLVPAAVMAALGFWGLDRGAAMTNDEAATRWAATMLTFGRLAHLLRHTDTVHGLYYSLIHVWAKLAGNSVESIRVPSVLALCVAGALLVVIGRRLTGSTVAGVGAGLVMAITPHVVYYAQTARSYAMVYAEVTALTLVLLVALDATAAERARARRWWVLYGALVTLAGYLNELALLAVAAHAITVLLARERRRLLRPFLVSAVVGGALVLPLAVVSSREAGAVAWIPRPSWNDAPRLVHDAFGATPVAVVLVAAALLGTVWSLLGRPFVHGPGAGAGASRRDAAVAGVPRGVGVASVGLPLLIAPPVLLIVESLLSSHRLFDDRYVLYTQAGAALLAGAGLAALGRVLRPARIPVWLPALAICAAVLGSGLSALQAQHASTSRAPDYGDTAFYLADHARPHDVILFLDSYYRKVKLGYPDQFRKLADIAVAKSPAAVGGFRGTVRPFSEIRPALLAHDRVWTIGPQPFARRPVGPMLASLRLLQRRYVRAATVRFPGVVIRFWKLRPGG